MRIINLCLAGALALSVMTTNPGMKKAEADDTPSSPKLELTKEQDVIRRMDNTNIMVLGDSLATREAAAFQLERDRKNRELLARESSPGFREHAGAEKVYRDSRNNCVLFAREETGINKGIGNGGRGAIQGKEPRVGSIGVQKSIIHAVVVEAIDGNTITVLESNFIRGWITRRHISRSDFLGFIYN